MLIPDLVRGSDLLYIGKNQTANLGVCVLLRRVCTCILCMDDTVGVLHKAIIDLLWLRDTQTTAVLLHRKLLLKIGWYHVRQVLFSYLTIQPKCAMITTHNSRILIHFIILHLAFKTSDHSLSLLRWLHNYLL
jgi:hypothetical protein